MDTKELPRKANREQGDKKLYRGQKELTWIEKAKSTERDEIRTHISGRKDFL